MSKTKRTRYSAEYKAKVALAAMRGDETIAVIAARYGIHPNQVSDWKKQATEGLTDIFSSKTERSGVMQETQLKDLHAKIGQLTVERDFLAKAFGR